MGRRILGNFFVIFMGLGSSLKAAEEFQLLGNYSLGNIYFRGTQADLSQVGTLLESHLKKIYEQPLFEAPLGDGFDILLDGEWKSSSGYWASDLKSPRGRRSLLFTPSSFLSGQSLRIFVHEYTHLLHSEFRPHEESWLREALALQAEFLVSGFVNSAFEQAFRNPETSLTEDLDPKHIGFGPSGGLSANYGHLALFMVYAYRQCGEFALMDALLRSPSKSRGVEFFDETLKLLFLKAPECKSFSALFQNFEKARMTPKVTRQPLYVLITALENVVRKEKMKLPKYSSQLYQLNKDGNCEADDQSISSRCLSIREN